MAHDLLDRPALQGIGESDALLDLSRGLTNRDAWCAFLGKLKGMVGASRAFMIMAHVRDGVRPDVVLDHDTPRWTSEQIGLFRDVHSDWGHLDPLRNSSVGSGTPFRLCDLVPASGISDEPYCSSVLAPFGLLYDVGVRVSNASGHEWLLGLAFPDGNPPGQEQTDLLRRIGRHLEEVVTIHSRLAHVDAELGALTETLDRLTICTFILDREGAIIRTNSSARRLIEIGTPFRVINDRLLLLDRASNATFQSMVSSALADVPPIGKGRFVDAMPVLSGTFRHLGLLVRTLSGPDAQSSDGTAATVVYVAGPCSGRPVERIVAQLFDLTPSEARLAALLAKGETLAEIARELDLSENTVRSYCKNILAKTGVSRQVDLVRLILRSVAVLG